MRIGSCLVLVSVLVFAVTAGPAAAKKAKTPDLVVSAASATGPTGGPVAVDATTANKGKKKAKASKTAVYLSTDAKQDAADVKLGDLSVGRLKPGKSAKASATFAIPASTAVGSYSVIACADGGKVVKEKSESNNCRAASGTVAVAAGQKSAEPAQGGGGPSGTPTQPPAISITATAGSGGTVAASAVSGGTCTGADCSLNSGAGSVTFTPTPSGINTFKSWTGCSGYTTGPGNSITFTNPTAAAACTATFNEFVTISWEDYDAYAYVSGCGETATTMAQGSCVVPKGSTATIEATRSNVTFEYEQFSGASCNGTLTESGSGASKAYTMTFGNVTTDHFCLVKYKFAGT